MSKKGQDIQPLDEDQYTSVEVNEFSSGDGFSDGFNDNITCENSVNDAIDGIPIKTFSFNNDSETNNHSTGTDNELVHNNNISQDNSLNTNDIAKSMNPSTTLVQKIRGLTPKVDGEAFDIKRCYQFRASTIKKLNQLKGESDNINIYLNEIIDAAICFYHDAAFNKK